MKDIDQLLVGTVWTRAKGEHAPIVGTIDNLNEHGPRLKLSDGSRRRLKWVELGFGWEPTDTHSRRQYELWKMADHIEYLDEKDAELKTIVASLQTDIESETTVTTTEENGTAVEIEQTKECHGPWHRHGDHYEQRPLSEFSVNTHGVNAGQVAALCDSCRQKQRESDAKRKAQKAAARERFPKGSVPAMEQKRPGRKPKPRLTVQVVESEPVAIVPGVQTPEGTTYRWRVTVVQPTEHYVQAKDFLDAAAQVASLGEVTKVEKL